MDIQWLFPTFQKRRNPEAPELSLQEIKAMKQDTIIKDKYLQSYELFLDFCGIHLIDKKSGK